MSYYQEGYDAYDHSKGLWAQVDCPYRLGTYARKAWFEGAKACRFICIRNVMGV